MTSLRFKRHSTGCAISKESVKRVHAKSTDQESFFWEKAVGFLVLSTLAIPCFIPNSPSPSSFPTDEDEEPNLSLRRNLQMNLPKKIQHPPLEKVPGDETTYENFELKISPGSPRFDDATIMNQLKTEFWFFFNTVMGEIERNGILKKDATYKIGFTSKSYMSADKEFKKCWDRPRGLWKEVRDAEEKVAGLMRVYATRGFLCFGYWDLESNTVTIKVSLPPGFGELLDDIWEYLKNEKLSQKLIDEVKNTHSYRTDKFFYEFPSFERNDRINYIRNKKYGHFCPPDWRKFKYENFTIVDKPKEIELNETVQPYHRWLKEDTTDTNGKVVNYYFFLGSSVFRLEFCNKHEILKAPMLDIWHPAIFQQVLQARDEGDKGVEAEGDRHNGREISEWRNWFRGQSQVDKKFDVNHQSFLRVLWNAVNKIEFEASNLPARDQKPSANLADNFSLNSESYTQEFPTLAGANSTQESTPEKFTLNPNASRATSTQESASEDSLKPGFVYRDSESLDTLDRRIRSSSRPRLRAFTDFSLPTQEPSAKV